MEASTSPSLVLCPLEGPVNPGWPLSTPLSLGICDPGPHYDLAGLAGEAFIVTHFGDQSERTLLAS